MRTLILTLALTLTVPAMALAMTCKEFETRVQAADTKDLLREFDGTESINLPGLINVENIPGIMLGLSCPDGNFEGLGATLTDGSKAGITRWSVFTVSVLRALAPEGEARQMPKTAAALQSKANEDAQRRKIRDGVAIGSAEQNIGVWQARFETGLNQIRFEIRQ
ncbi:hypothetical protein [Aureimonas phyllosphaerae]|uniref:Uncharacterized protein n=1 Tax=Aureimonas phyllosphaerae TaxID=1166078 RepID=A0A7W6C1V2_9HYPH|nr:hypothetical protein [Aureimonas phyllosphaerae]MBB3937946.1 hypothetical protein [Aureimonas phyllosphaerae]MBB3961881.1 hypothetical protein [Aureimonas phyllosphaerae]SFF54417.1 hypothetical protein SAMN05216566_1259 [Aureimonas phyllosphaerae]